MSGAPNGNGFIQVAQKVAKVGALVATVFVAPRFWRIVDDRVWLELSRMYDPQTSYWLFWGLWLANYPLVFFVLQLVMVGGITLLLTLLITRLS